MAINVFYCDPDLGTGSNDGTSPANAWQSIADISIPGSTDNPLIYIKAQSVASTTNQTLPEYDSGYRIKGYSSTINDEGPFELNAELSIPGKNTVVENFYVHASTTDDPVVDVTGEKVILYRCKIVNDNSSSSLGTPYPALWLKESSSAINCVLQNTTTGNSGVICYLSGGHLFGCYIQGSTTGVSINNDITLGNFDLPNSVQFCQIACDQSLLGPGIFLNNTNAVSKSIVIANNTIYRWADGILFNEFLNAGVDHWIVIMNNIIYNCLDGIDTNKGGNAIGTYFIRNAMGLINTDEYDIGDQPTHDSFSFIGDPFNNSASYDFTLVDTTNAGKQCIGSGVPIDFDLSGVQDNYLNIGAFQSQTSGGTNKFFGINGVMG